LRTQAEEWIPFSAELAQIAGTNQLRFGYGALIAQLRCDSDCLSAEFQPPLGFQLMQLGGQGEQ
jgi:hypothetical protein